MIHLGSNPDHEGFCSRRAIRLRITRCSCFPRLPMRLEVRICGDLVRSYALKMGRDKVLDAPSDAVELIVWSCGMRRRIVVRLDPKGAQTCRIFSNLPFNFGYALYDDGNHLVDADYLCTEEWLLCLIPVVGVLCYFYMRKAHPFSANSALWAAVVGTGFCLVMIAILL